MRSAALSKRAADGPRPGRFIAAASLRFVALAASTLAAAGAARSTPDRLGGGAAGTAIPAAAEGPAKGAEAAAAQGAPGTPPAARGGSPSASLPSGVFLRVNGIDVPRERFMTELNDVLGDSYRETFIAHVLLDEKARSLGITVGDPEIDAHVQTNVDQVLRERFGGDTKRMDDALKDRGMTTEGWKKRLRIDGRYDLLLEKLIVKDRTVSEETLKRLFEEKHGAGGVLVKIRHILKNVAVATSADYTIQQFEQDKAKVDAEAKARAQEALGKLASGQSFESVMEAYSDDPRKATGGILNAWTGRYGAEMDDAGAKLKKGERSGVLKCPDGYRIVECTDVTDREEVHAQHILVAVGARGSDRSEEDAKKRAEEILAKIKAGSDFETQAKENSDDPSSAVRGGDLGFFGRKAMVKPFEDAAFAMTAGQMSDLVRTNFGFHIIKILEKRTTQDKTLRQIHVSTQFSAIKDRKLRPGLEAKARASLQALSDRMGKGASFAELASASSDDLTTKSDGGLIKSYRAGLYGADFDDAVATMKPGDPPRLVKDLAGNLHLVVVDEVVKTDFEQVRGALEAEEMRRAPSPQEKSEYVGKLRQAATVVP